MSRRLSRGTPAMLSIDEQETFIKALDASPSLARQVETIIGQKLDALTYQQKVAAVSQYQEVGRALAAFNAAARSQRDTHNLAADIRGEVALADRVAQLEADNEKLRQDRDRAIKAQQAAIRKSSARTAEPAMAVHS